MKLVLQGNFAVKLARTVLFLFAAAMFLLPASAHAQTTKSLGYDACGYLTDPSICTLSGGLLTASSSRSDVDLIINSGTFTQTANETLVFDTDDFGYVVCNGICTSASDHYVIPASVAVGAAGTYDLQAGALSVPFEIVSGTMNQTGGANQLTDSQAIHVHCFNNACSTLETLNTIGGLYVAGGTYNLSAGTAQMPILNVDGGGTFNQTGGNVTIIPNSPNDTYQPTGTLISALYVGLNGTGNYSLSGGTLQTGGIYSYPCGSASGTCGAQAIANEYIGYNAGSNGVFTQSGGTNQLGQYNNPANPFGGGAFGNLYVGYFGAGTYNQSGGILGNVIGTNEYIGYAPGSTGTFNQTGGQNGVDLGTPTVPQSTVSQLFVGYTGHGNYTLGVANGSVLNGLLTAEYEYVGTTGLNPITSQLAAGSGTFVQNSGFNLVGAFMFVGDQGNTVGGNFSALNPQGTYTLNGGAISDAGGEYIGFESVGIFVQNGGVNQTASLEIASGNSQYAGDAAYALNSGTLTVCCSSEIIGDGPNTIGIFNQSGGLHQTTEVVLGITGQGSYNISGGTLDGGYLELGEAGGSGSFEQNGGTVDLLATFQSSGQTEGGAGSLQVGVGGNGTYDLGCVFVGGFCTPGGGTLNAGNEEIGETVNTSFVGTFNQYAGTTNTITHNGQGTGILDVGESGQGVYNQFGGTLTANTENIAQFAATGTFNQSGGTNNVVSGTFGTGVLNVGNDGTGTYNLSGPSTGAGATTLNAVNENVGYQGSLGTFNQSGGVNNVSGTLIVGAGDSSSAQGYYFQTGGLLNAANETIGNNFTAQSSLTQGFSQTGGTNTVTGTLTVGASQFNQNAPGVYVLDGGTLNASTITIGSAGLFAINPNGAPNGSAPVVLLAGTITNNGTIDIISGPSTVITASGANFVDNGVLSLDPATLNFGNFNFGANGYLKGALGDLLNVSGNFLNNSTQGSLWNSSAVTLDFGNGLHDVFFSAGSSATMFNWGSLVLGAGANLTFNAGSGGLFANAITLGSGSGFCGGDIFYDVNDAANSSFKGATDTFSCGGGLADGQLIPFDGAVIGQQPTSPTPEPAAWVLLLSGLSLLGGFKWMGKLDF